MHYTNYQGQIEMTKDCISRLVSTDAFVGHFEVLKFLFISKYQWKLDFSWYDPFKTPAFTMVDSTLFLKMFIPYIILYKYDMPQSCTCITAHKPTWWCRWFI